MALDWLRPTTPAAPDVPTVTAADMEAEAVRVAARIPAWFAERRVWRQAELRIRARAEFIEIDPWISHPTVRATGIRGVMGMLHAGSPDAFFVLERGGDRP